MRRKLGKFIKIGREIKKINFGGRGEGGCRLPALKIVMIIILVPNLIKIGDFPGWRFAEPPSLPFLSISSIYPSSISTTSMTSITVFALILEILIDFIFYNLRLADRFLNFSPLIISQIHIHWISVQLSHILESQSLRFNHILMLGLIEIKALGDHWYELHWFYYWI